MGRMTRPREHRPVPSSALPGSILSEPGPARPSLPEAEASPAVCLKLPLSNSDELAGTFVRLQAPRGVIERARGGALTDSRIRNSEPHEDSRSA